MIPLVAVAHGSRDPRAAATIERLMSRVRAHAATRGPAGLPVRTAYLGHAAPSPGQVLGALPAGPVVVLPLLLTAAYHSRTDLPAVLCAAGTQRASRLTASGGRATGGRAGGGLEITYGDPLGPHPLLIAALERRLAEAGVTADPGTSVVLAAAGSSDPGARATIARLAARWRAVGGWRDVLPSYASAAAPTPAQAVTALRAAGARRVVVASYLLAPGRFADQVCDQAADAGAAAVSGVLGDAPEVADLVLTRYAAALASPAVPHSQTA